MSAPQNILLVGCGKMGGAMLRGWLARGTTTDAVRIVEPFAEAAEALRLTAQNLAEMGVCDRIVKEPLGGAHRAPQEAIASVGKALEEMLKEFDGKSGDEIRAGRRQKYLDLGSKGLAA